MKRITRNRIQCLTCHKVVESTFTHDFRKCDCPSDSGTAVYADGGKAYLKRAGNPTGYIELSKYEGDDDV